jgi:catechol 2,3-dioxygenase-like lactoylglutathione lyase family enzyme
MGGLKLRDIMTLAKAIFQSAFGYQGNALNLPVADVEAALPFYRNTMGFEVRSRGDSPHRTVVLGRDGIEFGLAENGGDPEQDGCFFQVDNAEAAFAELKANGLGQESPEFRVDKHGEKSFKVFFVVAPDGLCPCLGEQVDGAGEPDA